MQLKYPHFHKPFRNSFFVFHLINNTSPTNMNGYLIENIDLYSQPLENPAVAVTFCFLKLVSIFIGVLLGYKVLHMLKTDVKLLSDVTKLLIITQMTLPLIATVLFDLPVDLIYPANEIIGEWYCTLGWIINKFIVGIVLNNSFITAVIRYVFIVQEKTVDTYGKDKIKRFFLYLAILLPFFPMILEAVGGHPRTSYINKCYGNGHRHFLADTNRSWKTETTDVNDSIDFLFDTRKIIFRIVEIMWFIILNSNITEAFVYYRIFSHMNRYIHLLVSCDSLGCI